MSVLQSVKKVLEVNSIPLNEPLVLGVSGGVDSMLLWHTLKELKQRVVAVHINYHLRGVASNKDAEVVKSFAKEHDLPLFCFDGKSESLNKNLQEEARKIRYAHFNDVTKQEGARFIVTAHNKDDNEETFFLNLIRGAGVKGLSAMQLKSERMLRPLLSISKEEIYNYAKEIGLTWREDESNQSDKYLRNGIRHQILPTLKQLDERAESGIQNTISILSKQNQLLELFVEKVKEQVFFTQFGFTCIQLSGEIKKYPQLLYELLKPYGSFDVDKILRTEEPGKFFESSEWRIWVDRGFLLLEEISEPKAIDIWIEWGEDKALDLGLQFSMHTGLYEMEFKPENGWMDLEKLSFPLRLRNWKEGEKFKPFGMKGSKKVSDYLTDEKIPVPVKNNTLVLESNGQIAWLVGHRIDDRFKVTAKTKKIYLATLLK